MHSPQLHDLEYQMNNKEEKKNSNVTNDNSLTNLNNNGTSKQTQALLRQYQLAQFCHPNGDYSCLDNPEISFNIQNLIDDHNFSEELFSDILQNQGKQIQNLQSRHVNGFYSNNNFSKTLNYMPQPVHNTMAYPPAQQSPKSESNSSFLSDVTSIKEEPMDSDYLNAMSYATSFHRIGNTPNNLVSNSLQQHMTSIKNHQNFFKKCGKSLDKDSEEYRNKRIRNNIAVRKSREKANQRKREIEDKNRALLRENENLKKQLESLTEELSLMKSLVNNFGLSPEQLSRELSKHLHTFQMQQQIQL